ncbi:MAG: YdeI/OmpD-associated family protein [Lacibacter sp.]
MPNTISQKLKIKDGYSLLTINAPKDFAKKLAPVPLGVKVSATAKKFNQVHWFVLNREQLEKEMGKVMAMVKDEVVCWIYYPKGTSKIQTDLTRDKGWDKLLKHGDHLTWISLISFDETWSTFGFRPKTTADQKKEAKPAVREIFNWVNPATKEVKLPDDLSSALKKNKKEAAYFETLSFTNKKEYIEWIVTAKQEKTREERVNGTIERLGKQWKNPRNI